MDEQEGQQHMKQWGQVGNISMRERQDRGINDRVKMECGNKEVDNGR